jgi:predicted RNA methylase
MASEWVTWHKGYDGDQPQTKRLKVVQQLIREALDRALPGRIRVISLCAGDGRDLLGVLSSHPRAGDVQARLVDLDPELVATGRESVSRLALQGIEYIHGDASTTRSCVGAVPADLVILCGIFGNISNEDIKRTIDHLSELCAANASVVWTRGRFEPDLTPTIRSWFAEAGFEELTFVAIPDSTAAVGAHRLRQAPGSFHDNERLFTFLPRELRPYSRSA